MWAVECIDVYVNCDVMLQMMCERLEWLKEQWSKLAPATQDYYVSASGLRGKCAEMGLSKPMFKLGCVALCKLVADGTHIIVMVTASHNSHQYNGIKVETYPHQLQHLQQSYSMDIQHIFKSLTTGNSGDTVGTGNTGNSANSERRMMMFIGEDMRETSCAYGNILKKLFSYFGAEVVDLGKGTTPEIQAMAQYYLSHMPHLSIQHIQTHYYTHIMQHLRKAFTDTAVTATATEGTHPPQISLDFSNGVGAVSFQQYYQKTLSQFLELHKSHHQHFSKPNEECGSTYLEKHPQCLGFQSQSYHRHYAFDGDCDRVLAICHGQLIDGDHFNALFTATILGLLRKCQIDVKIGSISNTMSDYGLQVYMSQHLGVQYKAVAVGIANLFAAAQNYDLGVFFEKNGHGGLYFSNHLLKLLRQLHHSKDSEDSKDSKNNPEVQLLLRVYELSRNNCKGYALHNFCIMELFIGYDATHKDPKLLQSLRVFESLFMVARNYAVKNIHLFKNSQYGNKELIEPQQLCKDIGSLLSGTKVKLIIRRSDTQPVLRLCLKGEKNCCQKILLKIEELIIV